MLHDASLKKNAKGCSQSPRITVLMHKKLLDLELGTCRPQSELRVFLAGLKEPVLCDATEEKKREGNERVYYHFNPTLITACCHIQISHHCIDAMKISQCTVTMVFVKS